MLARRLVPMKFFSRDLDSPSKYFFASSTLPPYCSDTYSSACTSE
ncbi:hypothetical protein KSS87_011595, partial [Heliosperma pusillum]